MRYGAKLAMNYCEQAPLSFVGPRPFTPMHVMAREMVKIETAVLAIKNERLGPCPLDVSQGMLSNNACEGFVSVQPPHLDPSPGP